MATPFKTLKINAASNLTPAFRRSQLLPAHLAGEALSHEGSLPPPRCLACTAAPPLANLPHRTFPRAPSPTMLPPLDLPSLAPAPRQMISIYNVTLSGSSKDLYADSVAVLSWATFNWDGA